LDSKAATNLVAKRFGWIRLDPIGSASGLVQLKSTQNSELNWIASIREAPLSSSGPLLVDLSRDRIIAAAQP